jgi:serine/threonine-protein kinase HipA
LCEIIRHSFTHSAQTLRELFARLCFNILVGNTDDHARNHAAFWDGKMLTLTPAYDICPQPRTGNESSQAMLITGQERGSRLQTCLNAAPQFHLPPEEAKEIVLQLIQSIINNWDQVCSEAQISEVDKNLLKSRVFLNAYIFEELREENKDIQELSRQFSY